MGGGRVKIGGSEGTNSEKVEIELDHTRRMVEGEGMQDIVSEAQRYVLPPFTFSSPVS